MPPAAVPTAEKNAIASARVSIGKISLTVRYAELAPAEAKKKITHHAAVCVSADQVPALNRNAVTISSTPDTMYVPAIIGLRPTESNRRPRTSGPRKLPSANGMMYQPTAFGLTP